MENDVVVSELLGLICCKKPTLPKEIVAYSSIPSEVLNDSFMKKLDDVLCVQQFIIYEKWRNYFEEFYLDMLSSHVMYIRWVMYACLYEHKYNLNIFDSFISVLVLVRNTSNDTRIKVGINFRDLDSDIIMIFYREVLKSSFPQNGGFYGFVEYIRRHKHLEWNWENNNLSPLYDDSALHERLKKEYRTYCWPTKKISRSILIAMDATAENMALKVLQTTSVDLPTLPSKHELVKRLVEFRKWILANKAEKNRMETTSTFDSSVGNSSSESKSDCLDIEWHENIVQAVIRHNQSNVSRHENVNNPKLVEAERTLEHLETSIKSLIEVLDKCNKNE